MHAIGCIGEVLDRFLKARLATSVLFLVNGAVVGAWVPYIPERALALSLSAGALGATLLGGGLGAVVAMPLAGALVPRVGSRLISLIGGVGFSLALLWVTLAPSRGTLFLALVTFGLCGAGMDVAMNAQAVLVEAKTKRRILSSLHGLYSLGNVLGSLGVSAAFARHVSPRLLAAVIAVLLAGLVLGSAPLLLRDRAEGGTRGAAQRSFSPKLLLLGALVFAAMISEGATADWSGLYMRNVRALGPSWAGVGFGVFSALMLAGRLVGDAVVARLGEVRTLRLGGFFGACGALLIVFGPGTSTALFGFALLGAGLANISPVLYRASGKVPNISAGVGLATAVGLGYAGLLAGPPTLGGVAQMFGLSAIFIVLAGLCLLLSVTAGFGAPSAP